MIFALTADVVLIYGTSLPGVGSGVETGNSIGIIWVGLWRH